MSAEQMQQMLDLLTQQVTTMTKLQEENQQLRGAGQTETQRNGTGRSQYKSKKMERPVIDRDIDDREWARFLNKWSRYKEMCELDDNNDANRIRLELRAACSDDVDRLLFEYVGETKLDNASETELMEHIKSVTVKTVHKEVHRLEFHRMIQEQGETITQWVARLRAKAFLCKFETPCKCCTPAVMTSYTDDEVAQRLVAGLRNKEHQTKVLAEVASLTTVDLKIERLQLLETTEESARTLHDRPAVSAPAKSDYKAAKMSKRMKIPPGDTPASPTCRWCGKTSHRGGGLSDRKKCPANGKKCNFCDMKGHLEAVCRKKSDAAAVEEEDEEEDQIQSIDADASVSFAFGAPSNDPDFRLGQRKSGKP